MEGVLIPHSQQWQGHGGEAEGSKGSRVDDGLQPLGTTDAGGDVIGVRIVIVAYDGVITDVPAVQPEGAPGLGQIHLRHRQRERERENNK